MRPQLWPVVSLLAFCLPAGARAQDALPASAIGETALDSGEPRVEGRLLVDPERAPNGALRVGVLLRMDPGWHVYWRNPGETGLPTSVTFTVDGGKVGPIAWPAPERFGESDGALTTFGYDEEVLLSARVERVGRTQLLRADVELLACERACIPGSLSLSRDVTEALASALRDPRGARALHARFEAEQARVPVAAETAGVGLRVRPLPAAAPDEVALELEVCACGDCARARCDAPFRPDPRAAFVAGASGAPALRVRDVTSDRALPGLFRLSLVGVGALAPGARLEGVLAGSSPGGGLRHVALDLPLVGERKVHAPELPAATGGEAGGLLRALALALLGGLVLNLMPCVLPVLALKLFALAELGAAARRERQLQAFAYAAGVLGSMLALALVVVALRAAGTSVGWGFQLQEPRFALAMCALLVVFALNLFGVFEFGTPSRLAEIGEAATGARRSFFEGLLAVALATPCTAPFLGTAVGFAFAGSAGVIVAIFLAVGAGLALPYLLAVNFPPFAKLIPRSGPWMLRLRTLLGFALLATAVWLLSVFGGATGPDGVVAALAFLLVLAFCVWLAGWWRPAGHAWPALSIALAVVAFALAGVNAITSSPQAAAGEAAAHDGWEPFDPARVREVVASGRPALVYFTADWCLTCKYNERFVLADAAVRAELERLGVVRFRADWTRRDESIRAELARFGRAGVPLAVVWQPGVGGEPIVLPELLSVDTLLRALRAPAARAGL
jgi:thiol:disulfide interchange protein DsbD